MRAIGPAAVLALAIAPACDRAPKTVTPASDPGVEHPGAPALVEASWIGATEDKAHREASRELRKAVFGDPTWSKLVPIEVHRRGRDPTSVDQRADGTVRVVLGLSRSRAAEVLSAFELAEPEIVGPEEWREALYAFVFAHRAEHACRRRRELFDVACEIGNTQDADVALDELARGVELAPAYADGIPLDSGGRPLRAPSIFVLWRRLPIAGVALVAQPVELRAQSDTRGRVTFELGDERWPGPLSVGVDAKELLGPLHEHWSGPETAMVGRPIEISRWSAIVSDRDRGKIVSAAAFRGLLGAELRKRGLGPPAQVPSARRKAILGATGQGRSARLPKLADELAGRLDILLVVSIETRFASRMGGTRVWFEAAGKLEAYETWSGKLLATVDESVTASGLSDERADSAARRKLAGVLVSKLLEKPGIVGQPASPSSSTGSSSVRTKSAPFW